MASCLQSHGLVAEGVEDLQRHLVRLLVHDVLQDIALLLAQLDQAPVVPVDLRVKVPGNAVLEQNDAVSRDMNDLPLVDGGMMWL